MNEGNNSGLDEKPGCGFVRTIGGRGYYSASVSGVDQLINENPLDEAGDVVEEFLSESYLVPTLVNQIVWRRHLDPFFNPSENWIGSDRSGSKLGPTDLLASVAVGFSR